MKALKVIMIPLLLFVALFSASHPVIAAEAPGWVIDGDRVYYENESIYLSATPHTLSSSGWVGFELVSKTNEGPIDLVWGFNNNDGAIPETPQYWTEYPHEKYRWIKVEKEGDITFSDVISVEEIKDKEEKADIGNGNNTKKVKVKVKDGVLVEDNEIIIACNSYKEDKEGIYTFTYNYDTDEKEVYYETYEDWKKSPGIITIVESQLYRDANEWHCVRLETNIKKDTLYRIRVWVEIPFSGLEQSTGKYSWGIKPADETLSEAIENGTAYFLDPWWDTVWEQRRTLTIDNTASSEDLINFPVLVHLDDSNIDWDNVQDAGQDIRFVDSDDATLLDYEIEEWDDGVSADIWVEVPQIDAGSDEDFIYMYYGNSDAQDGQDAEGTWNDNYVTVQHMYDNPDDSHVTDSTQYNNDGTKTGPYDPPEGAGLIGNAQDYTVYPDTNKITVADDDTMDFGNDTFTVEILLKQTSTHGDLLGKYQWTDDAWGLTCVGGTAIRFYLDKDNPVPVLSVSNIINSWQYLAAVFDRSTDTIYLYQQGSLADSDSFTAQSFTNAVPFTIGKFTSEQWGGLGGLIDEVRLSDDGRSADWIEATNLSLIDSFITYGDEENAPASAPANFTLTAVGSNQVDISWVKGQHAANTMVRRNLDDYPEDINDGVQIYYGSGDSYSDSGDEVGLQLELNGYYYRAWSENAVGEWSEDYAEGRVGSMMLTEVLLITAITALAFWRRELYLYIVALVALVLFSIEIADSSLVFSIPLWILALYMAFKSITYWYQKE